MEVTKARFQVQSTGDVPLRGWLYYPEQPKAVVQFNCGTATLKEFYEPFLTYLAANGYVCALWDYRGSGESRHWKMRICPYTFSDYGVHDMPAVKFYLRLRYPKLPFLMFGHSAGGQQVGLMPDLTGIKGMVNFGVSAGDARNMRLGFRLKSFYFFYIFSPVITFFTGYIKAKIFGIMEDLPRNVLKEWRAWCASPDYLFDPKFLGNTIPKGLYHDLPFPVHTFWAVDDDISNELNTQSFWRHVQSKHPIGFTKLDPAELGVKRIGHFGFFRKEMKDVLWPMALQQLDRLLEQDSQPA